MSGEKGRELAWRCMVIYLLIDNKLYYRVDMICESADLNRKEFLVIIQIICINILLGQSWIRS